MRYKTYPVKYNDKNCHLNIKPMTKSHCLLQNQLQKVFDSANNSASEGLNVIEDINKACNHSNPQQDSCELTIKQLCRENVEMRTLLESTPDLIIHLNEVNNIISCHEGSESDIQLCPTQVIGKPIHNLAVVDSENILIDAIATTRQKNEKLTIEYEVCHKQIWHYLEARLIPLNNNNIVIVIRDISTRKKTEHGLQLIEGRLRRQNQVLIELARQKTLADGELDTLAKELTKAAAEALGVERASIWLFDDQQTKIECIDLFQTSTQQHSDGMELFAKDFPAYLNTLKSNRVINADDAQSDPRTCEFNKAYLIPLDIKSMLDAPILLDGKTVGILCLENTGTIKHWAIEEQHFTACVADLLSLTLEVRARKEAQQALSESEEKFRTLAETTNSAIFVFQDNFLYINPAMEQLTGYSIDELLKINFIDIVEPEYKSAVYKLIQLRKEGANDAVRFEVKIIDKQGDSLWLLLTSGLISFNGKPANIATAFDITERKFSEEQLHHQAFHDQLTGLPNRALFIDRLNHTFNLAKFRNGPVFAVLFIDLDRFKVINDSLGHDTGDQLLKRVTERLKQAVRDTDTIARLGGDEFTILLEGVQGINYTIRIAKRIRAMLSDCFDINGHELYTSASIGIAMFDKSYETPDFILRDADIAMYRAKKNGRAGHEVFNSAMHAKALSLAQLETDLRNAIERDQLQLYYQPIINLESGELLGFESLLRWHHHDKDLISPMDFIPIAEETGIIIEIGLWAIKTACRQLYYWQNHNNNIYVSVNVSAKQIAREDFVDSLVQIIKETGINPTGLKIELTETMLIDNPERIIKLLDQLRSLGIKIYVDDFGTGYSSLSYLHRFPIDVLKIDRSFVNMIGNTGENTELVNAIVTLTHSLKMSVIAEGIENKGQMDYLKKIGCTSAQGFYFSRPVPIEQTDKLLAQDSLTPH